MTDRRVGRAVSTAVSYVLTLGITTLLVTGLLIAAGGAVEDRRDATIRNALEVSGQRLAAHLMAADRLATTDGMENVVVAVGLPDRIAGSGYEVEVDGASSTIVLEADGSDVTRRVSFANSTAVANATVRGGDLRIVLSGGKLEVRSA